MFTPSLVSIIAGGIGGGLVAALALTLLARYSHRHDDGDVPLAVLARRYRWWEAGGVALMLLSCVLSWLALRWLSARHPEVPTDTAYRLTPHTMYWVAAAFFLGNLAATGPTHVLYAWALGERFAEFRTYQTRKFGFDSWRWMLPFYLTFGSFTVLAALMLLDWYVVIGPNGIVLNDVLARSERSYSYNQVLEIRAAEKTEDLTGVLLDQWGFVLYFDDHRRWSSRSDPSHGGPERWREMATYISQRSGLPIVDVPVLGRSEQ